MATKSAPSPANGYAEASKILETMKCSEHNESIEEFCVEDKSFACRICAQGKPERWTFLKARSTERAEELLQQYFLDGTCEKDGKIAKYFSLEEGKGKCEDCAKTDPKCQELSISTQARERILQVSEEKFRIVKEKETECDEIRRASFKRTLDAKVRKFEEVIEAAERGKKNLIMKAKEYEESNFKTPGNDDGYEVLEDDFRRREGETKVDFLKRTVDRNFAEKEAELDRKAATTEKKYRYIVENSSSLFQIDIPAEVLQTFRLEAECRIFEATYKPTSSGTPRSNTATPKAEEAKTPKPLQRKGSSLITFEKEITALAVQFDKNNMPIRKVKERVEVIHDVRAFLEVIQEERERYQLMLPDESMTRKCVRNTKQC